LISGFEQICELTWQVSWWDLSADVAGQQVGWVLQQADVAD
jgi:hypothetical protein